MSDAHIGTTAWESNPIGRYVVKHAEPWGQRDYVIYDREAAEIVFGPDLFSSCVHKAKALQVRPS